MKRSSLSKTGKSSALSSKFLVVLTSIILLSLTYAPTQAHSASVSLGWNPSSSGSLVAGYNLYYGYSSGDYNTVANVGDQVTYTFPELQDGTTYYFAVTAYDSDGNESDYSEELSYLVPVSNHSPVAESGTITLLEDTAFTGILSAADADGDPLTYSIMEQPAKGSVTITDGSTGAFRYTPDANANGADSFTFNANDGTVDSNTATITVSITPVNDAPLASNGSLTATEDTAATGNLAAIDGDGDALAYSIVLQPAKGSVTITNGSTGAYRYTPNANANGADSFTFNANDGTVDSNTATITVSITSANDAPVASHGSLTATEDTVVTGSLTVIDGDGDALTYSIVQQPGKGSVAIIDGSTGAFRYTPDANANGADSFTFKANDGTVDSNTATITVSITPVNDAPVASNGSLTSMENKPAAGKLIAIDGDDDTLVYTIVQQPGKGLVAIINASTGSNSTTGAYRYIPNPDANGADTFTFKVNDGKADSNIATVNVTISDTVTISLEAEQGSLSGPISVGRDKAASGRKYAYMADPLNLAMSGQTIEEGRAEYTFEAPVSAEYLIFARVRSDDAIGKSFELSMDYGELITWRSALGAPKTWLWDKMTDESGSGPASFYLEAGTHTLALHPRQYDSKIDRIVITTAPGFLGETVYEDAEDGTTGGWDVPDANPDGAQILNVYDENRRSNVIELTGSGTKNSYQLLSEDFTQWENPSQFVVGWSLNYTEKYKVAIDVQTTAGRRRLVYSPLDRDALGKRSVIQFGVGKSTIDGQWHRFVRDLQADLEKAQPGVRITAVNSCFIRGSGRVDDITLRPEP